MITWTAISMWYRSSKSGVTCMREDLNGTKLKEDAKAAIKLPKQPIWEKSGLLKHDPPLFTHIYHWDFQNLEFHLEK